MIVVEVRCSSVHKTNVVLLLAVECKQRWRVSTLNSSQL